MFIIDDRFLIRKQNKHHKQFFDGLDEKLAFEFIPNTVGANDGGAHFSHHFKPRDQQWVDYEKELTQFVKDFTEKHFTFKKMHRCAMNITFNNGVEKCPPHFDHEFKHYQILLYLTDTEGDTVIGSERVSPKKYRLVLFDNQKHYHFFPKQGVRKVIVFTFSIEKNYEKT